MKIKELLKRFFKSLSLKERRKRNIIKQGELARDKGIQQSVDNANSTVKNWSDIAYGFLLGYSKSHREFMIEDLREASVGVVQEPPSKRAWGAITVRAVKNGVIKRKGYQCVKNVKAHRTPATLWEVV